MLESLYKVMGVKETPSQSKKNDGLDIFDIIKKNKGYIIIFVVFLVLHTENKYACDRSLSEIAKLRTEVKNSKYECLTIEAELTELSRQSQIKKMSADKGIDLVESNEPPYKIK